MGKHFFAEERYVKNGVFGKRTLLKLEVIPPKIVIFVIPKITNMKEKIKICPAMVW
jgi:hypothetical protein